MKGFVITAVLLFALGGTAMAAGNAKAGATKVDICESCHGAQGCAVAPMYPNLAGQHSLYIEHALKAYRGGQRRGGTADIMAPEALHLSDQDIADIAAYFSQLKSCQK